MRCAASARRSGDNRPSKRAFPQPCQRFAEASYKALSSLIGRVSARSVAGVDTWAILGIEAGREACVSKHLDPDAALAAWPEWPVAFWSALPAVPGSAIR
jgi:hypothetical protein